MRHPPLPLVVALLVVLAFAPGSGAADVRGQPDLSAYVAENDVVPGEETILEVVLLNDGSVSTGSNRNPQLNDVVTTARGTTAELDAGDTPVSVETGTRVVGSVPTGASQPIPFRVTVDESAEPGTYELPITVNYTYTWLIEEPEDAETADETYRLEADRTRDLSITVEVEERARFEVVGSGAAVAVGERGNVTVELRNVGSAAARDSSVTLRSPNPDLGIGETGSAVSYVGSWRPNETQRLTFGARVAPDAERRRYALRANVSYEDRDGQPRFSEPLSFGVTPRAGAAFAVRDAAADLRVGEEGTLSGTVVNTGGSAARNAVVVLRGNRTTVTPVESEVAVGDLAPGEAANFSFEAAVSEAAAAGERQFSLVVRYRDADGDTLRGDPVDVRAEVQPERDAFAVEATEATLAPGGSGRLDLVVTNRGDEPVTDVSAKLFADDPVSATDDEAFVQRLEPGERANLTFGVSVAGDAVAKEYPVTVDFQYDDADGDTLVSDAYRVPVTVAAEPRGDGLPLGLGDRVPADGRLGPVAVAGVALVAVALAVVGWRRFGR